jgi:UDP-N-acetylmuramoyl-tripeptide--D-alanyl-D-alanine ligase
LPPDGTWIKNLDDELLAAKDYDNIRVITYAIKENSADFKAKLLRQADNNMEFRLEVTPGVNKWQMGTDTFSTPLLGLHNIYNALAAIAASSLFVDAKSIKESLPTFKAPHMRMEVINTNGFTIINDAYNSNPLSFRYAASSLREYPARGKRILVCADMLELGKSSQMLHYECGRFLAENKTADFLIAFGSDSYSIVKGAIEHGMNEAMASFFKDKNEIVPYLRRIIKEGDVVLVKGSRAMKMEEIVDCFTTCSTR